LGMIKSCKKSDENKVQKEKRNMDDDKGRTQT